MKVVNNLKKEIAPSNLCNVSNLCGGCKYLDEEYNVQLEYKTEKVKLSLKNLLGKEIKVNKTIGAECPFNYRNKAKFAFGYDKNRRPIMGFFEEGRHNIVVNSKCKIQDENINEIAKFVFEIVKKYSIKIYNEDNRTGFLRYLIIKKATQTNEVMIIFVTTDSKMFRRESVIKELITKFSNIKTIVQNINVKQTSAILGEKNINLYGNGYIMDYMMGYKFKISPLSFYQVNTVQAERLYSKVVEFAGLTKNNIVYDLYCGIGTISLSIAKYCKKVFGIEVVNEAIRDAKENARINNIKNVEFICGKTELVLPRIVRGGTEADVVIVDPPRNGLDRKTVDTLLMIKPKKIIYVSCNPESLARDLNDMIDRYEIIEVQPVDMFCFTSNVECVMMLESNENW